jgi:uncharacterized damage-inducible protein DinB
MSLCALSCEDLLGYGDYTAGQWRDWFAANEVALDVACDINNTGTVRGLVQHIFAVELRFAQRLLGEDVTPYDQLPIKTLPDLFAIHALALEKYRTFLRTATEAAFGEIIEVKLRTGQALRVSRRDIFVHAHLHASRHWAQIATVVRHAGYPQIGPQDYLLYGASRSAS